MGVGHREGDGQVNTSSHRNIEKTYLFKAEHLDYQTA